jgi:hypothetical protein
VEAGEMMDMNEVLELYAQGFGCGVLLSVIPLVVGELINFSINLMKKG